MQLSRNEKELLGLAYKNYLDNGTREYTLRITSSDNMLYVSTLRSFAERGIINPLSDNFYDNVIPICPKYVFELTDDGINLAETSNL